MHDLVDNFVDNKLIHPNDKDKFNLFIEHHRAATMAPVLMAEMIRFEQKLNRQGIKSVYLFPGYGELTRFVKNRFGLFSEIPLSLRDSGNSFSNHNDNNN